MSSDSTTWERIAPVEFSIGDVISPPDGGAARRVERLEWRPGIVWVYFEHYTIGHVARVDLSDRGWLRKVRP